MPVNSFFNNSKVDGEEYEAADVEAIEQGFYDVEQAMVKSTNNLSDVASASAARTNLGLGGAAILSVGTTAGTVAAGDHNHTGVYEAANANIQAHVSSTSNPHNTTKTHVGLGNVDNTSDADKPVSTAQQTALNGKEASIGAKGTAFNKNFGTTAGTVSEGNHTHSGTYEPAQTAASQAEMEAGTETALRSMSPIRVKQAIDALASTGLSDDSVTLAKLAHGTAGNLIAFDATGAPAAVATGSSGQVLTSNGAGAAPTMQAVGGAQVAIGAGTIAHGGTIPLPSGYTEGQCKWMVSMNNTGYGSGFTLLELDVSANGTRTVNCRAFRAGDPSSWENHTANYIIIGVK
jgi:hypothetical protein